MVQQRGSADALIDVAQKKRYSYSTMKAEVDRAARGLLSMGIEKGDRVGIWSTNNAEWLISMLAIWSIGGILVNINPSYKTQELEYVLKQSGVKLLITVPGHRTSDYLKMLREIAHQLFSADSVNDPSEVPELQSIFVIGNQKDLEGKLPGSLKSFDALLEMGDALAEHKLEERMTRLQFDEPINIQYTSGTTGFPKGVTLSHHNLLNNSWAAAQAMGLDENTRFCVPMPFYHCGGMVSSAMAALSVGGATIIPSPFYDEEAVLQALSSEKCTHLSGVPTMFIGELEHPEFEKFDLSNLKGGFMAGAPCPVQLMRKVADKMHMNDVVILYGLTEASPLITATTISDSLELRATTVGKIIPALELKLIDAITGEIVPRGVQGELCTRGHGVMLGYWNNPNATAECIDSARWLHSGDLAVMNEDGYVNITGRKKDMIIRGGENIYPREIEEVMHGHPDVVQAQVFGIPDEKLGEDIAMWIMIKPGSETKCECIKEWLRERVAYFKVPKHIRIVKEFPMTVTGKIQKFVMRKNMIAELGLDEAAQIQTA
ncbi:MAG: AMP-binding protein [Leptolyngbya sp.]|nr:AMP-binding protein [Candidatus Melainabacteria bacterium]